MSVSPFQAHCQKWANGCGSDSCGGARKVFARGKVPCRILLVGEAPGESEDTVGYPFKGPAGRYQDGMLEDVDRKTNGLLFTVGVGLTNMVCCIPRSEGAKAAEPSHDQIENCTPRLEEFIAICRPRLLVAVGKLADEYLTQGYRYSVTVPDSVKEIVHVTHPAAIIRAKLAQQSLLRQRYIVVLASAVLRHFGEQK